MRFADLQIAETGPESRGKRYSSVTRQLLACVKVNYKFYRRNSLLMLVVLLLIAGLALMAMPAIYWEATGVRAKLVTTILGSISSAIYMFTALVALITVYQNLRDRSLKMVITKPCPVEVWMLANFAGALGLMIVLYTVIYLGAGVLLYRWDVLQPGGLVYTWAYVICRATILFSFLTLLTTFLHPVVAGVIAFFLREGTFLVIYLFAAEALRHVDHPGLSVTLRVLKPVMYALYMIVPIYSPYEKSAKAVASSLEVQPGDLAGLGYTVLYTLVFASFCYFLGTYLLKRKRLI